MPRNLIDTFLTPKNNGLIPYWIDFTTNYYRPYDPGQYLYRLVLDFKGDKFSNEFIELTYTTLISWNMNQRAARLSEFAVFNKSIIDNRGVFESLSEYRLEEISSFDDLKNSIQHLYIALRLVRPDKPKLVTFSKTLHLFLPHLFMPIDRAYTIRFFNNNTSVPKTDENQFKMYTKIFEQFKHLSMAYDFERYRDKKWNQSIPKIIDNLIIGYIKQTGGGQLVNKL